jgi:hypothetical protein
MVRARQHHGGHDQRAQVHADAVAPGRDGQRDRRAGITTVMASSVVAALGHGGRRPVGQAVRLRLENRGSEAAEPLSAGERELPFGCVRGDKVVATGALRDAQAEERRFAVGELPRAGEHG